MPVREPDRSWAASLARAGLGLLSPGASRGRLTILIYHRVLSEPDPLFPEENDVEAFDRQMGQVTDCFNVIPLHEALRGLRKGKLPARAACVTFDDGYADNAEIALPVLRKHGIPATFFVASGVLDGGRMWNDTIIELIRRAPGTTLDLTEAGLGQLEVGTDAQRRGAIDDVIGALKHLPFEQRRLRVEAIRALVAVSLPDNLMMTSDQVRHLHGAGMEIGGHTVNHPILASMEDPAAAHAEIAHGKEVLESIIRARIRFFAYPNGKPGRDYLPQHVGMVRQIGFEAAVSTAHGAARMTSDPYQLPRFTPWDRHPLRFGLRMVQNMLKSVDTV
ncbi:polysaccharide deacetylase family protein [Nitrosovibrio sp. Nv17]|uniref:polysaccharide deacetylase family protein n=1 Tax=Nitrosovibrio sp. Nv17 TaxID=1855339 RepID=UPI000908EAD5|nr:Polysaccharide deacetylase [Nitrosovibrio sp. Nv17]